MFGGVFIIFENFIGKYCDIGIPGVSVSINRV